MVFDCFIMSDNRFLLCIEDDIGLSVKVADMLDKPYCYYSPESEIGGSFVAQFALTCKNNIFMLNKLKYGGVYIKLRSDNMFYLIIEGYLLLSGIKFGSLNGLLISDKTAKLLIENKEFRSLFYDNIYLANRYMKEGIKLNNIIKQDL